MDTFGDRASIGANSDNRISTISPSAMSWEAILGGAVAAVAMSLILFILGIGLGLTSISPWSQEGISAEAFGIATILWITFTSFAASALGGYLTGRLRTRWVSIHTDEVYFRDTAHGFLAWCVATLLTATLFTSLMTSLVSGGAAMARDVGGAALTATSAAAGGATAVAGANIVDNENANPIEYFLDSMFRQQAPAQAAAGAQQGNNQNTNAAPLAGDEANNNRPAQESQMMMAEVERIFMRAVRMDDIPQNDLSYIANLVSSYTDIPQRDAEARVRETYNNLRMELEQYETAARNAAEEARETSAQVSLWFFISLLIGAFIGSFAATIGGRQRDL